MLYFLLGDCVDTSTKTARFIRASHVLPNLVGLLVYSAVSVMNVLINVDVKAQCHDRRLHVHLSVC